MKTTLPPITNKQQEIITHIIRFRFLDRINIQLFLKHKNKRRVNEWLPDLVKKEYLKRIYSKKFGENIKPAVYYLGPNGIRWLKTQKDATPPLIRKLYREKERSDQFIAGCGLIAGICLDLRDKTNTLLSYEVITQSEFADPQSPFHFLSELNPHLIFLKQEVKGKKTVKTHYVLELFEPTRRYYSLRHKIRTYLDFYYSNQWENAIGKSFPVILFVFWVKADLIYAKRFTKKLLQEEKWPENFHIWFATAEQIKKSGVTGEVWEDIEPA